LTVGIAVAQLMAGTAVVLVAGVGLAGLAGFARS
jgi:hypothetical protein